jgi:hypothetical protein
MTAGESTPNRTTQREEQNDLQLELSKQSEKLDDFQAEIESIASALQGGQEDEIEHSQEPSDLEKAATQASHGSHGPVTRITTAVDW